MNGCDLINSIMNAIDARSDYHARELGTSDLIVIVDSDTNKFGEFVAKFDPVSDHFNPEDDNHSEIAYRIIQKIDQVDDAFCMLHTGNDGIAIIRTTWLPYLLTAFVVTFNGELDNALFDRTMLTIEQFKQENGTPYL